MKVILRTLEKARWPKAALGEESGQSLIEVAVSLPLLLTLLIGSAEFARLAYAAIEVSNAAKAGVQYGAQNSVTAGDTAGIQTAASNEAANLQNVTATGSKAYTCTDGSAYSAATQCPSSFVETTLTVTTSTTYDPLIHLPGFPGSMTLRGHAAQKVGD
jgi:Flp pilus assembly protein TadG